MNVESRNISKLYLENSIFNPRFNTKSKIDSQKAHYVPSSEKDERGINKQKPFFNFDTKLYSDDELAKLDELGLIDWSATKDTYTYSSNSLAFENNPDAPETYKKFFKQHEERPDFRQGMRDTTAEEYNDFIKKANIQNYSPAPKISDVTKLKFDVDPKGELSKPATPTPKVGEPTKVKPPTPKVKPPVIKKEEPKRKEKFIDKTVKYAKDFGKRRKDDLERNLKNKFGDGAVRNVKKFKPKVGKLKPKIKNLRPKNTVSKLKPKLGRVKPKLGKLLPKFLRKEQTMNFQEFYNENVLKTAAKLPFKAAALPFRAAKSAARAATDNIYNPAVRNIKALDDKVKALRAGQEVQIGRDSSELKDPLKRTAAIRQLRKDKVQSKELRRGRKIRQDFDKILKAGIQNVTPMGDGKFTEKIPGEDKGKPYRDIFHYANKVIDYFEEKIRQGYDLNQAGRFTAGKFNPVIIKFLQDNDLTAKEIR